MEKRNPDDERVLHLSNREKREARDPLEGEVESAAVVAWPGVLGHVRRELGLTMSRREADALAAEVWEGVTQAVSKALRRGNTREWAPGELEKYLFKSFHRRFNRFLKTEQRRRERFKTVSSDAELERIPGAQNNEWVPDLEREITIKQIIAHMDSWTKAVWEARVHGYSWKDIARRFAMTEASAKRKFQYGLEKTREKVLNVKRRI